MRRILVGLGVMLGLAVAVPVAVVQGWSSYRFNRTWTVADVQTAPIPTDAASIDRGRHFAVAVAACTDCHGADGAGRMVMDVGFPVGTMGGPNITGGPGSRTEHYTDVDWFRTLRHGVDPAGRALQFMPSHDFAEYSLQDNAAIIAWAKSLPPQPGPGPTAELGPVMRFFFLKGDLDVLSAEIIDHDRPPPPHVDPAPTAEYGARIAIGCRGCHGPGFSGGPIPGLPPDVPPAGNLTPHPTGIGNWTFEEFERGLREGRRYDGQPMNEFMPYKVFGQLTDTEMRALWAYLQSLPPREKGKR